MWNLVRRWGEGKQTRPWLFSPSSLKRASSHTLQCALQQSRNQAGHRLLSFSSNHRTRIPPSYLKASSSPLHPCLSWMFPFLPRACLLFWEGVEGLRTLEPVETEVVFRKSLPSWSGEGEIQANKPSSQVILVLRLEIGRGWSLHSSQVYVYKFVFMGPGEKVFWTEHAVSLTTSF